jgi:hypothetical protein
MHYLRKVSQASMSKTLATLVLAAAALLLPSPKLFGQQTYVSRFDTYVGYAFLDSPHVSLFENGMHFQFGVRPKTWYSLGFDYSVAMGNLTLTPNLLTNSVQQQLAPLLAMAPAGYQLAVSTHSHTQTFAAGPQLAYRHFAKVTLFFRPDLGAMYERATPHATDEISTLAVRGLAPAGYKTSWTPFGGFGGGADLLFSKHFALRVQADLVYDHLFSDILRDGRLTTRFSIGPCFNFGGNIAK